MTKLRWESPPQETDPARVVEVKSYPSLKDGQVVMTQAEKEKRARKRAKARRKLLKRSEKIRQEQIAKKLSQEQAT